MKRVDRRRWDDRELVTATLAGDRYAGDILFARYDNYSQRIAQRYTSSPDAAAEAVAAGKALAFEKLDTLRDPDRFGAWMASIVRNSAASAQRQQSREVPHADVPEIRDSDTTPEDSGPDAERLQRARKALLSLSPRDRHALELSVYQRMPAAEVAAALMIDVNTAYQVLSRARKRARRAYLTPDVPPEASAACHKCAAATPDYLRGLQSVRAKVDAHLETCSGCRARLAEMLVESSRIKGLFSLAPIGIAASVRGFISRRFPHRIHAVYAGAVVSSMAVIVGAAGVYLATRQDKSSKVPSRSSGLIRGGVTGGSADTLPKSVAPPPTSPEAGHSGGTTSPAGAVAAKPPSSHIAGASGTTSTTSSPGSSSLVRSAPSAMTPSTTTTTTAASTSTTSTTTAPTDVRQAGGTYLTGNGTPDDKNGNASASWVGTASYGPGPIAGTQGFEFDGADGLTDNDLAQLGSSNFTVSFDLDTVAQTNGAGGVDLLGYRTSCLPGDFFDMRLSTSGPGGLVVVEFDTASAATVMESTVPVNNGAWHFISFSRDGTKLTLRIDGVVSSTAAVPAGASVSDGSAWQVANGDPCLGRDGTTALIGSMADIYVGPTADDPSLPPAQS